MRVLVIGGGGREHALSWTIRRSPLLRSRDDLICVPGNPGIEAEALCLPAPSGGLSDVAALAALALRLKKLSGAEGARQLADFSQR